MFLIKGKMTIRGFSVIELMVAVTISTILLIGLIQMLVSNKNAYQLQTRLAQISENGHFAMDFMMTDVRLTGALSCSSIYRLDGGSLGIANNGGLASPSQLTFSTATAVKGYEAAYSVFDPTVTSSASDWNPTLPTEISALNPVKGSDILEVRYMDSETANVSGELNAGVTTIALESNPAGIQANDVVILSDCTARQQQSDMLRVSSIAGNQLTVTPGINRQYDANKSAEVGLLRVNIYYVADTGQTNGAGVPILGLFRYTLLGGGSNLAAITGTFVSEQLIQGVENLQINYGLGVYNAGSRSSRYNINRYAKANEIDAANNWFGVLHVHIAMLLNSIENLGLKVETYDFDGSTTPYTPYQSTTYKDYRLRRELVSTAAIRGRTSDAKAKVKTSAN